MDSILIHTDFIKLDAMLKFAGSVHKMADIAGKNLPLECEYITKTILTGMDLASGSVHITAMIAPDIFKKILVRTPGITCWIEPPNIPVLYARPRQSAPTIRSNRPLTRWKPPATAL